jgi:hypothetical protein
MDDGREMVLRECDECRERPAVVLRYCGRCALDAIGTAPVQALTYVEALRPKVWALAQTRP